MDEKIHALQNMHTLDLVPRPLDVNVARAKWVYHNEFNANGFVEHLKYYIVTQGNIQVPQVWCQLYIKSYT